MIKLTLEREELLVCANVLTEVRTGFHVPDFVHVIGSEADTDALQQRFEQAYCEPDHAEIVTKAADLTILVHATRATLQEFDHDTEFRKRVGVSRPVAFLLLSKLETALAAG